MWAEVFSFPKIDGLAVIAYPLISVWLLNVGLWFHPSVLALHVLVHTYLFDLYIVWLFKVEFADIVLADVAVLSFYEIELAALFAFPSSDFGGLFLDYELIDVEILLDGRLGLLFVRFTIWWLII